MRKEGKKRKRTNIKGEKTKEKIPNEYKVKGMKKE